MDDLQHSGSFDALNANFSQAHDALVASLAYSELGITKDMTFDEISAKLLERFPEWTGYLYKYGQEYENITGGFTAYSYREYGYSIHGCGGAAPALSKNSDHMVISLSQGAKTGSVFINNAFDFTNYNSLFIEYSANLSMSNEGNFAYSIGIADSKGDLFGNTRLVNSLQSSSMSVKHFDISKVSGKKFLNFALFPNVSGWHTMQLTIKRIWVE